MPELTGPIPNPFRAFNNMTYGISLYLMSNAQYNQMMATGKKDVTGMELLIQSGGASTEPGDAQAQTGNYGAKRNKYFTRDFYLDDIQLSSYISGTATGGPQNTFEMKFAVTEPMGLTFMERLYNASTEYNREVQKIENFNPVNQFYLVVIRFYGYDKDGKQILNAKFNNQSDPNSYIEKWIPIMIRQIQFRVETNKVVYNCECVCPQTQVGHGQVHGTIPFNPNLQGSTLQEILGEASGKMSGGTEAKGLMYALNNHQKKLVSDGKIKIANKYSIKLDGPNLENAVMDVQGTPPVERTGNSGKDALPSNSASIKGGYSMSANAGIKIVKMIDLAVRSSKFITSQYRKVNDANRNNSTVKKADPDKPLIWFKIRPEIKVLGFDEKRQSYAYDITYVVSEYEVSSVDTNDFNSNRCLAIHKEYDFWFTGNNTEVLRLEQDYNTFYYTTFSSKELANSDINPAQQTNYRAMRVYRPNSTEAHTGENLTDEQAANAASVLYAPQDIASVELDILGDPDWLGQSELFYAASQTTKDKLLEDGSINYDTTEVYFTINFNTVVDYELDKGLADVTQNNVTQNLDGSYPASVSQYAFTYRANTITTQFEKGSFKQRLNGTLVFIPEQCIIENDQNPGSSIP